HINLFHQQDIETFHHIKKSEPYYLPYFQIVFLKGLLTRLLLPVHFNISYNKFHNYVVERYLINEDLEYLDDVQYYDLYDEELAIS
ncbi:8793_t:CDS:1, partial [Funneliformis mosseae]